MDPVLVQSTTRRTSDAQATSDPVAAVGSADLGAAAAGRSASGTDASPSSLAESSPIIPNCAASGSTFFLARGAAGAGGTTTEPSTQPARCPMRTRARFPRRSSKVTFTSVSSASIVPPAGPSTSAAMGTGWLRRRTIVCAAFAATKAGGRSRPSAPSGSTTRETSAHDVSRVAAPSTGVKPAMAGAGRTSLPLRVPATAKRSRLLA